MKKIILLIFILGLLGGFFFYQHQVQAQEKTKNLPIKPQIFIQYETKPGICSLTTNDQTSLFGWNGWKLPSGITDYRINYSGIPSNLSPEAIRSIFDLSFSNIQGAGGGILFHYAGESQEFKASDDGQNTIRWSALPAGVVAMTYVWTENGRLRDADTIFNQRYTWTYTDYNGSNDCSGYKSSFDLRNIATHEFGHWTGLGDIYNLQGRDLTMYGYASRGELKKGTLGLGDIVGVRAVWP